MISSFSLYYSFIKPANRVSGHVYSCVASLLRGMFVKLSKVWPCLYFLVGYVNKFYFLVKLQGLSFVVGRFAEFEADHSSFNIDADFAEFVDDPSPNVPTEIQAQHHDELSDLPTEMFEAIPCNLQDSVNSEDEDFEDTFESYDILHDFPADRLAWLPKLL